MIKRDWKNKDKTFFNIVDIVPLAIPVSLAIFGVFAVLFLLFGAFRLIPIVLFGACSSMVAFVVLYRFYTSKAITKKGSISERRFIGIILLIFITLWVGFNLRYNSQHVYTNRDPAVYAVTGAWLVDHSSVNIARYPEYDEIKGINDASAGFGVSKQNSEQLYAQGTHILPAFLGLFGRVVGKTRIYPLNVLFGAAGLLAVYALAREIVKPRWSLVAVMTLAMTLPMVYFSRDTYTEPLALAFGFSGLALLLMAYRSSSKQLWFLSGLTIGATVLTRIDAYMMLAFIIPFLTVYVARTSKKEHKKALSDVLLFTIGVVGTAVIGYLDVKRLSSGYYLDTWHLVRQELLLIACLSILGVSTVVVAWRTKVFQKLNKNTKSWRTLFCTVLLVTGLVTIFVRPLVYDEYKNQKTVLPSGSQQVQRVRDYKEEAPYWVVWYAGPITVLFGSLGLVVMTRRLLRDADDNTLIYLLLVSVVLGTALVYFIKPSIAADQIWASRRMLPVIIPGFIVASVFMFQEFYDSKTELLKSVHFDRKMATAIIATVSIATPLYILVPYINSASFGQLAGVLGTCNALPKNSAVLWVGLAKHEALMSTRAFCGETSVGYYPGVSKPDRAVPQTVLRVYAKKSLAEGRTPILGRFDDDPLVDAPEEKGSTVVADGSFTNVEYIKGRPPRAINATQRLIRLSIINSDGSVGPLVGRGSK